MLKEKTVYVNRVFRAAGNRLYLTGGSNSVTSLYTSDGFEAAVDCKGWEQRLIERKSQIEAGRRKFIQLLVPEKLTIYPLSHSERQIVFPGYSEAELAAPGKRLIERVANSGIIYPDQYLKSQSAQFDVFPMTDSHWTWKGAFSAFQLVMSALAYKVDYSSFLTLPKLKQRYHGDLWEQSESDIPPEQMERVQLPSNIKRLYSNALMGLKEAKKMEDEAGLHQGSHCIFYNDAAEINETTILFGSSFSEARLAPSLLTAILCNYFRVVHFIWSTSIDLSYVQRHEAALVISEIPERFLNECPKDELSVEKYAALKFDSWNDKKRKQPKDQSISTGDVSESRPTSYADFPKWDTELEKCCRLIETPYAALKVLLKTKNEPYFLEKWIIHHLAIAGKKNLIIFDNMSDNIEVLNVYLKYQDAITVIRFNTFHNWVHDTAIYPDLYRSLANACDFFAFLDSDEFLVLNEDGRIYSDTRVLDFISRHSSANLFPGLWLNNTDWNESRFVCGTTPDELVPKAAWGKPIVRSKAGAKGFLNHNGFFERKFFDGTLKGNIFVLHMTNLSLAQRINANVNKLIARGFAAHGEAPENIVIRSRAGIKDFNVHLYIDELKKLIEIKAQPVIGCDPLRAGCFEIRKDRSIMYYSDVEQRVLEWFINNPTKVFTDALEVADKRDDRLNPGTA